jgi:hypothetical protein
MKRNLFAAAILAAFVLPAQAANVVDEWASVKAPAAPTLKPVTVDRKTTALLLLDFINPNCTNRPRCMENVPAMKRLLTEARAKGMLVAYSLSGQAAPSSILPDLAPQSGEPVVKSGADKFYNSDLEKTLKDRGVQTVIVTGTAAHGAALYTASGAAMRGFNVIAPVDGMTAENPYLEQVSISVLINGVGGIAQKVTLTRSDMIKF